MALLRFSKFSPGGNDTLFLHCKAQTPDMAARALAMIGGEQAGFVDTGKHVLLMAGGEFCVNACRAFGALIDMEPGFRKYREAAAMRPDSPAGSQAGPENDHRAPRHYRVTVSGWNGPVELEVAGQMPSWQVCARLSPGHDLKKLVRELDSGHTLVRLPGIDHLLCWTPEDLEPVDMPAFAREKCARFGLQIRDALGVVAVARRSAGQTYGLLPYVMVPALGTAMVEGCCGSATLALGLACMAINRVASVNFTTLQPQSSLAISAAQCAGGPISACIGGPVVFMLEGLAHLPEDQSPAELNSSEFL